MEAPNKPREDGMQLTMAGVLIPAGRGRDFPREKQGQASDDDGNGLLIRIHFNLPGVIETDKGEKPAGLSPLNQGWLDPWQAQARR